MIAPKNELEEENGLASKKILYYNAFTEDLFYWDNDLQNDIDPKLKIHPNVFTKWVFEDQGQDSNIIDIFQHYTDEKLTPHFNSQYTFKNDAGKDIIINAFSEVTFSYERGNDEDNQHIKISKGEESCFIWSIFYSLLDQVVHVLNIPEENDRETNQFDKLEDDIYKKIKDQNIIFNDNKYWYPDLYVNFHVFPNSNGKYFIYASPSSGASNGGVYLIYYDQSWYVTKNKSFRESDFLNVDSIKNAVAARHHSRGTTAYKAQGQCGRSGQRQQPLQQAGFLFRGHFFFVPVFHDVFSFC